MYLRSSNYIFMSRSKWNMFIFLGDVCTSDAKFDSVVNNDNFGHIFGENQNLTFLFRKGGF